MPTIAAIATPAGQGGIGIVRISGPGAKNLLARVFLPRSARFINFRPWTMHRGVMMDSADEPLDDVLAVYMPGPRTYTGEDMAEIHCHGGSTLVEAALASLLRLGARLANPGEFSRRAYLNGRMDLSQAEAVAELIAAPSREAIRHGLDRLEGRLANQTMAIQRKMDELRAFARISVDFPDDEIESLERTEFGARVQELIQAIRKLLAGASRARLMREGAVIALAGAVNAGKSSLLNALCGRERALVTDLPGTTRDFIEEPLNLNGLPARLIDTAGLRNDTSDHVEALGMQKSREIMANADLVALVIDSSAPDSQKINRDILSEVTDKALLLIWNKNDLGQPEIPDWARGMPSCHISALTGENVDELAEIMRSMILEQAGGENATADAPPNARQAQALEKAQAELELLFDDIKNGQFYDCCLTRLDTASQSLGEIMALAADSELLDRIFSQFCIGK